MRNNNTATNWRDLSEIVFGLTIAGRIDINKLKPTMFCDEYEQGFTEWHKSRSKTKLIKLIGGAYEAAVQAAGNISDESSVDIQWNELLGYSARAYAIGTKAERVAKKLKQGVHIEASEATEVAASFKDLSNPESVGLVDASSIDLTNYEPLELSGTKCIDDNLGGFAKAGNIMVMGTTGVGKSLFTQWVIGNWLDKYPNRKIAMYNLEMPNEAYLSRGLKLFPKFKKAVDSGRVLISDRIVSISDIGIEAASMGVDGIVCDYIDYLIKGQPAEGAYAEVYITQNNISRSLSIPFWMVIQPNRNSYETGIPKMWHARYSGMCENIAAQFLSLYKPKSEEDTAGDFVYLEDSMYIAAWKSRFGWLNAAKSKKLGGDGRARKGPGAIVLPMADNVWDDSQGSQWLMQGDLPQSMTKGKRRKNND